MLRRADCWSVLRNDSCGSLLPQAHLDRTYCPYCGEMID